jgi:hypothetical protein
MSRVFKLFDDRKELLESYSYEWGMADAFVLLKAAREANDRPKMIKIANEMWAYLPDHGGIRSGGFFALCNIAEEMYEDDDTVESEDGVTTGS